MLRSETANAPARQATALRGLRRYQEAERAAPAPPAPELARVGRACVRDYGGAGPPVLFVPSLINPPDVLDLDQDRSLLRWLATQGLHPLLLDWGSPASDERELSVAGHVEHQLLPLLDRLGAPVTLAGYCLGGTMALAAAALRPVRGLALLTAPWRFAGYPSATRANMAELWRQASPTVETLGLMPMEVLQAAFWQLDPARTVAKYEVLADADAAALAGFVRLEDWANDGPPLTAAAAREILDAMFARDLPGGGEWHVAGEAIDLARIRAPVLEVVSTTDRIVPAAAAAGIGTRHALDLGHVGMIVGGRARAALWKPLARWLLSPA